MADVKVERKETLSGQEAAVWLSALSKAFARGGDVTLPMGTGTVGLHLPEAGAGRVRGRGQRRRGRGRARVQVVAPRGREQVTTATRRVCAVHQRGLRRADAACGRRCLEAGLDGLLVTPGPDLVWLTGYQPTAITERLTVLVLAPDREPTLLVPTLERPDAEGAVGAPSLAIVDWADGEDPFARAGACSARPRRWASRTRRGRCTCSACRTRCPDPPTASLTQCLPMLRAVKDANELARLEAAGAAADATYEQILEVRFAGRKETDVAADLARLLREFGHEQVDFTVVGSGPNGANPHHEAGDRTIEVGDAIVLDFGGLMYGYGSDTSRTVCVGEPSAEVREVHEIVRRAQQAASRRSGRASPARRSTGRPGR